MMTSIEAAIFGIVYFKPQEGIDYLLYQNISNNSSYWVSIYPCSDRIVLGGVYEHGQEEQEVNPEVIDKLIQNAVECLSAAL